MEDDYILDLKKHYMLKNEDEKYDVVPEIWEGHNLADFVDPEIQKVNYFAVAILFSLEISRIVKRRRASRSRRRIRLGSRQRR